MRLVAATVALGGDELELAAGQDFLFGDTSGVRMTRSTG